MLTHPQGEVKAEPFKVVPEAEPPKPVEPKTAPPKPAEPKVEPAETKPESKPQPDAKPKRSFLAWWAAVVVIVLGIIIGVTRTSSVTPFTAAKTPSADAYTMVQTSYSPSDVYFWRQQKWKRSDVKTITFRTVQDAEKDIPVTAWDVSSARDRSVVAWMVSGNLHVAATGKIVLNSNASGMFASFANLTEIDFGHGLDTSKVTNMRSMFYDCGSLTSLDLSGFDTSNVTNMQGMFSSCSSLSELDLSGFDTSKVTDMARMFSSCGSLSKLDLSGFDSSNVGNMEDIFYGCSSLKSLTCSDRKILAKYSASAASLSTDVHVMARTFYASGREEECFWGKRSINVRM